MIHGADIVYLNVGGVYYCTRRQTLLRSDTFFAGLANNNETELFVDRDPTHFRHILNWLRGVRYLPEDDAQLKELACEADFYAMIDMRDAISRAKRRFSLLQSVSEISSELRRQ